MIICYIKEENKNAKKTFQSIEIRNFENNYIIALFDKNKKKINKKIIKYIKKYKIDTLVFSKELDGEFKEKLCEELEENIKILNGKTLMEFMEFDIIKYIFEKQTNNMKKEDIYIIFKKDPNLNFDFLKKFIENFRMTNIVTNDIERLKTIQDNLLKNDNILIAVSNNKKKALKRAKYILNINLNKEELEKYRINREAIIINIQENVKYDLPSFDGINVNYFEIELPDEYIERIEPLEKKFDLCKIYESILLSDNMQKNKLEYVYERINNDNIKIINILGNNGRISPEELQKIHKMNLDKMRKLV